MIVMPVGFPTPLALLSFQYKWVTPNSVLATNAPLFLSSTLSKSYQMVSVTFKAVFLALFALPQVLAVPGGTVPRDNGWPKIPASIKDAALNKHNEIRANANVPPLSWSDDLQKKASARLAQCPEWADANSPGTPPDGLSLFTGDTHV